MGVVAHAQISELGKGSNFFYLALLGSTAILGGGSRLPVSAKRR
uniref:Uncharacterized protein n=1 Tax=Amphimedon queenslandica TaxID=400682 RepID=A0A1X7URU9_AMPQE